MAMVRFEFPYMAEMRRTGNRKPPNREAVLLERWNLIIDRELASGIDARRLVIGGKSLGGRMASLIADKRGAAALVCLSYPFHPAGKAWAAAHGAPAGPGHADAHLSGHPRHL
jgi:predicted alpha/beta-hydrolase family hydrolase